MKSSLAIIIGALCAVPAHAAVYAHYPFDSNYTDSSGNGRDGTLTDVGTTGNSGIITSTGNHVFGGGAMDFADEADYVALDSTTFSSGVPYTIAFWAQRDSTSNQWNMVVGDQSNNFFIALNNNNTVRWRSSNSTSARQEDFAAPADTDWHHYAFVASGSTITMYLDGDFVSTGTGKSTGFIVNGIGSAYGSGSYSFRGRIDEMWILDEAADADTITNLFTSNTPADSLPTELLHHPYDSDFTDSSVAENDGTASGAAAITSAVGSVATGGGALALDGADASHVDLDTPITLTSSTPWSTTWWARRGETGAQKGMVMGKRSNTNDFIWLNDNFNGLRFRSSTGSTFDFSVEKDTLLHHYALVADGTGTLTLYRNGEWVTDKTGDTSFEIDTVGLAYTTASFHYAFQGSLDEVRVFDGALDALQVDQIYNTEKPVIEPDLTVTRLRILLLGGQSNGDGRAAISGLPTSPVNLQEPQSDVDFFYKVQGGSATLTTLRPGLSETSQFGPEITLGRKMADLWAPETGTRVAVIKYANGGTNLHTQWKGGGDGTTTGDGSEYVVFQQTVTSGLATLAATYPAATLDLQGMVWMQGESDANSTGAPNYETNLTNFIADVRATYGADLPFTIARLSSGQTAISASYLAQIRAAQDAVAAADPRTALLSTDAFGMKGDNLHFDSAGQQSMGTGFAGETAYYEWMVDTFNSSDINAGLGAPDIDRDGDGRSNFAEFQALTDPLSAASFFKAELAPLAPGSWEISYASSVFRYYAVEQFLEVSSSWEEILPPLQGTGMSVKRPLTTPDSRGIYRVRSTLP